MSRLIAIGDIHGCDRILRVVLDGIKPQADDVFVFLGDFCNRGPNTKGVIDEVLALGQIATVHTILGNHEEMILGAYQGGRSDHDFWTKFGGDTTLASFGVSTAREIPGAYLRFLADCKDYIETDDYIFVHAGADPAKSLDKQSGSVLRWTKLDKDQPPHQSGKTVVCGHTAQKQVFDAGHLLCIDTGCGVWPGGRLTAVDLTTGTIWQAGGRSKTAAVKRRDDHAQLPPHQTRQDSGRSPGDSEDVPV